VFGEAPPPIRLIGVESHSNDTNTRGSVRFGRLHFDAH
jgi:hypothetical protein